MYLDATFGLDQRKLSLKVKSLSVLRYAAESTPY